MKRIAIVTALLVAGLAAGTGGTFALLGGRSSEEEVARLEAAAQELGHAAGYEEGKAAGYVEGEDAGFQRGETTGFEEGQDAGFEQGLEQGKGEGYDSGYEDGYQVGFDDWYGYSDKEYDKAWQAGFEAGCLNGGGNINVFGECLGAVHDYSAPVMSDAG